MQALQPALHDVALDDLILKYTELALSWHALGVLMRTALYLHHCLVCFEFLCSCPWAFTLAYVRLHLQANPQEVAIQYG